MPRLPAARTILAAHLNPRDLIIFDGRHVRVAEVTRFGYPVYLVEIRTGDGQTFSVQPHQEFPYIGHLFGKQKS